MNAISRRLSGPLAVPADSLIARWRERYECCNRQEAVPTRPSITENREVELAEALGVGDYIHLHDLPARDRHAEYPEPSSVRCDDDSHRSIHERRSSEPGTPRHDQASGGRVGEVSRGTKAVGKPISRPLSGMEQRRSSLTARGDRFDRRRGSEGVSYASVGDFVKRRSITCSSLRSVSSGTSTNFTAKP